LVGKLDSIAPGTYRLIILDAWYRFLPKGVSENDNSAMTEMYNVLDSLADRLQCGFVLIHHASKGSQTNKAVTDVGAGAGAQARAADSHLILRAHEEDGCFVLDAGARSFPQIEPVGVRFTFPVWRIDESLDPALLKPDKPRKRKTEPAEPAVPWTAERFAAQFVSTVPKSKAAIISTAAQSVGSARQAETWLAVASENGLIHRHKRLKDRTVYYASVPQATRSM
jgi:hypothetical protein